MKKLTPMQFFAMLICTRAFSMMTFLPESTANALELMLEKIEELPIALDADIHSFIDLLEQEPFDQNSLNKYGLKNEDVVELLKRVFG